MSERMAVRVGEGWLEVGDEAVEVAGIVIRRSWLDGQDEADLAARGLVFGVICPAERPEGVRVVGSTLQDVDGVPTEVLETVAYTSLEVATLIASTVARIKAEAQRRILLVMDATQQANALALGQELLTLSPDPDDWPQADRDLHAANMAKWASIKAIRAASNAIEQALPGDPAALFAFDPSVAPGWPE